MSFFFLFLLPRCIDVEIFHARKIAKVRKGEEIVAPFDGNEEQSGARSQGGVVLNNTRRRGDTTWEGGRRPRDRDNDRDRDRDGECVSVSALSLLGGCSWRE